MALSSSFSDGDPTFQLIPGYSEMLEMKIEEYIMTELLRLR
jgi:hypothetical protein